MSSSFRLAKIGVKDDMATNSVRSTDAIGGKKAERTSSSRMRPEPGVWPTKNSDRFKTKICSWISCARAVLMMSFLRPRIFHVNVRKLPTQTQLLAVRRREVFGSDTRSKVPLEGIRQVVATDNDINLDLQPPYQRSSIRLALIKKRKSSVESTGKPSIISSTVIGSSASHTISFGSVCMSEASIGSS